MVEAALVMPLLITFLALEAYVYNVFTARQEVMAESRNDAFSKALRGGCDGSVPFPVTPETSHEQGASEVTEHVGLDSMVSAGVPVAQARSIKTASNANVIRDPISTTVSAHSYVYCNTESGVKGFFTDAIPGFIKIGFKALKSALL